MFRPTKVKHYLRRMAHRGFAEADVLRSSGISAHSLDNPEYLIDISQSQRVVNNMLELTGNPSLAFELGQEVSFEDFGILGYALMSCRTLREVTDLWASLGPTLVGTMLNLKMIQVEGLWRVEFREIYPLGPLLRFCTEENFTLGNWIAATVIGRPLTYKCVEFAYPAPESAAVYEEVFKTEVIFDAPVTATNILSPTADEANEKTRDTEFYRLCQQYCFQILRQISESRPLAFKMRQLFLDGPGNIPSVEEAAKTLNMSERTLKRHLQGEGISYQQLVNEFRNEIAKEYMRSGSALSLQQISDLLGYADAKSFSRAFKNWNDQTVSEFRKSLEMKTPQLLTLATPELMKIKR